MNGGMSGTWFRSSHWFARFHLDSFRINNGLGFLADSGKCRNKGLFGVLEMLVGDTAAVLMRYPLRRSSVPLVEHLKGHIDLHFRNIRVSLQGPLQYIVHQGRVLVEESHHIPLGPPPQVHDEIPGPRRVPEPRKHLRRLAPMPVQGLHRA
jgi:hypothetical protein